MRTLLTVLVLGAALVVGLYKSRAIWQQELWRDRKVVAHLLFWSNGVLGMTLFLTPVYVAVDRWAGLNNLSWLLAYLLLMLPIYLVGVQVSAGFPRRGPLIRRLLKAGNLTTTVVLVVLYVGWIQPSPEWPQRTARTLPDLLFITFFFATVSALPLLTLGLIRDSFRRRGALALRLRMSISAVAMVASLVCFGHKILAAVAAYALPDSPLGGQLDQVAWAALGMTAVAWMVSMLPRRFFLIVVGPVLYLDTLHSLVHLRRLYARVTALIPPVVDYAPTWGELVRQPDFHRYRLVIGVLDGRKMIPGRTMAMRQRMGMEAGTKRSISVAWTRPQWRQAEVLEDLLLKVCAEEMEELVGELVAVSREAEALLSPR